MTSKSSTHREYSSLVSTGLSAGKALDDSRHRSLQLSETEQKAKLGWPHLASRFKEPCIGTKAG